MDAAGTAWVGGLCSIVGGCIGATAAWALDRRSKRKDRLLNAYGEWAVACHEVLVSAETIGANVAGEIDSNPNARYSDAAQFYMTREPGHTLHREYRDLYRNWLFADIVKELGASRESSRPSMTGSTGTG